MDQNIAIVIPARMDSVRLPNKPLIKFGKLPMIIRVASICSQVIDPKNVFVSTPDDSIMEICDKFGIQVVKSSVKARSGTDRVSEFATNHNFEKIINVQGDELLLQEDTLKNFITNSECNQNTTIGITQISNLSEINMSSVVKVACSNNRLIYASRAVIPFSADTKKKEFYKHTGLYMFTKKSLEQFSNLKAGNLELTENIEILRFIENRVPVETVSVSNYLFTIDTDDDVVRARLILET